MGSSALQKGHAMVSRNTPITSPVDGLIGKQTALPAIRLSSSRVRSLKERLIQVFLFLCAAVSILTTIGIILSLFQEAIGFFLRQEVSLLQFLTGTTWRPLSNPIDASNFGVLPLINGTLIVATISAMIALPLGVGSAIYLSEYARERTRSTLKPMLEVLAGIPSVVYGYFALSLITPLLTKLVEGINARLGTAIEIEFFNALSASLVMGVMILPLVASLSEDAMRAVPRALREGAYGLGATKFEVATRIVVPASLSGILAGFILALSRAIGETMIVAIAAGSTPRMTLNPLESIQTMTGFIVQVSFGDTPAGSISSQSIFAIGATLFVMTFFMNILSNLIVRRFREEYI
jgi:phosphate transport system permease protein